MATVLVKYLLVCSVPGSMCSTMPEAAPLSARHRSFLTPYVFAVLHWRLLSYKNDSPSAQKLPLPGFLESMTNILCSSWAKTQVERGFLLSMVKNIDSARPVTT